MPKSKSPFEDDDDDDDDDKISFNFVFDNVPPPHVEETTFDLNVCFIP